jgi:hypothetical protein
MHDYVRRSLVLLAKITKGTFRVSIGFRELGFKNDCSCGVKIHNNPKSTFILVIQSHDNARGRGHASTRRGNLMVFSLCVIV